MDERLIAPAKQLHMNTYSLNLVSYRLISFTANNSWFGVYVGWQALFTKHANAAAPPTVVLSQAGPALGLKQYRSMLYCVLCLSVLQYIAILQYLIGFW